MLIDKLNIILNSNDEFSPKYIISSFVKNNLNDIPTMSIDAIALSCHTSKSQISKYVKSLGYETMKDFKDACLDNISSMERTNKTLFSLQNSIEKQFSSFTNHIIDELHYTMNQIDEINLLKLVNDIKKSKRMFMVMVMQELFVPIFKMNFPQNKKKLLSVMLILKKNIIFKMVIFFYSLVSMEIRFTLIKEWCIIF